jgi:hypothetical protein
MIMTNPSQMTYSEIVRYMETARPDILDSLMPRKYNVPLDYWPPKIFAVAGAMSIDVVTILGQDTALKGILLP